MQYAITVQELSKHFHRHHSDRPNTLKESFLQGFQRNKAANQFWALRNVSFNVAPGRMLGIIGRNGAGKSTLLRLISGLGRPTAGSIAVNGRVGALLELGAGFHPDLTGRENVIINGVVAGLTLEQVDQLMDKIVSFAELQRFMSDPLRTYSTGMQMRLAFSIAIHAAPKILLVDEVLAVGDMSFQRKCLERIADFKDKGGAIILVSHDPYQVRQLCDEVLWLRAGELVAHGEPEVVTGQYIAEMSAETRKRTPTTLPNLRTPTGNILQVNKNRFGSLEVEITGVCLLDADNHPVSDLKSGDSLKIEIEYSAAQPIYNPIFGVSISQNTGQVCFDVTSNAEQLTVPVIEGQGRVTLQIERLDLNRGSYYVDVGIYERNWEYAYDYHWHVYSLQLETHEHVKGILHPPYFWTIDSNVFVKT